MNEPNISLLIFVLLYYSTPMLLPAFFVLDCVLVKLILVQLFAPDTLKM